MVQGFTSRYLYPLLKAGLGTALQDAALGTFSMWCGNPRAESTQLQPRGRGTVLGAVCSTWVQLGLLHAADAPPGGTLMQTVSMWMWCLQVRGFPASTWQMPEVEPTSSARSLLANSFPSLPICKAQPAQGFFSLPLWHLQRFWSCSHARSEISCCKHKQWYPPSPSIPDELNQPLP